MGTNDFSSYTRSLFMYRNECWECGYNKNLDCHHIYRRVSDSPFNLAPLCRKCHRSVTYDFEHRKKYFMKTFKHLRDNTGHEINERDEAFFREMGNELEKIAPELSSFIS
jgi:hypothetical protein